MRALLATLAVASAIAPQASFAAEPASEPSVPRFGHVFVIVLENHNYNDTFGPSSQAPYLTNMLRQEGVFLPNYYAVTHVSLGNYIAVISGQGSNIQTRRP